MWNFECVMLKSNSINILVYVLATGAGLYLFLVLLTFLFQSNLIYFPDSRMTATPHDIGLEYDAVSFKAADGVDLSGWFVPGSSKMVVLFCHGNAGNISDRLDSLQIFHKLGLNTFIFDYRGYGESSGRTTEEGTYRDSEGAWDFLLHKKGFTPENVIVFGRSLGGAIAAHLAMARQPGALILESTFTSIPDLGASLYPFFPVRLLSRFKYSVVDFVGRAHSPILVVHSPDDDIVPYALGTKVYRAANEPKEFLEIAGDHNNGFIVSGDSYVNGLRSFINKYVAE